MIYGEQPDITEPSVWLQAFLQDLFGKDVLDWWMIHPRFRRWFLGWFPSLSPTDADALSLVDVGDAPPDHPDWPAIESEGKRWFKGRMPTYDYYSGDWSIVRNTNPVSPDIVVMRVMRTGPVESNAIQKTMEVPGYLVLMRFDPDLGLHAGDWYLAGYGDRIYEPEQGE